MIISFFLIFGLVSASFSVSEFNDLAADVELNLHLLKNIMEIMKEDFSYHKELNELKSSLKKFSDALKQPKVLRMFCGFYSCDDPIRTKILNKFQIDTCNPFAETASFDLLDRSKFSEPLPENINIQNFKKRCNFR